VIGNDSWLAYLLDLLVTVPGVIILRYVYRNRQTTADPDGCLVPVVGLLAWTVFLLFIVLTVKVIGAVFAGNR
jgi:hypothetical protein